jgi:hypothetical protein
VTDPRIAYRARGVPTLEPRPQRGSMEEVADDLGLWVEATADAVAEAMKDGDHAPFSARVSQQRLAEFYGTTLWDTNGMPSAQLWLREYHRVGADGLREAVDGGAKWRRAQGLPVTLPPPTAMGSLAPRGAPTGPEEETPAGPTTPVGEEVPGAAPRRPGY